MLVLALDTATPAVTAGVVELYPVAHPVRSSTVRSSTVRSTYVAHDARKHGELLMPGVLAACGQAGVVLRDLDAVVVGTGPGPFTGLRVGMVTAAALGDALEIPVHGICTLDAIACDALPGTDGNLLVVTDARRREVYWAVYDPHGRRLSGPHVGTPAALTARLADWGVAAAAGGSADGVGPAVREPAAPSPGGLVAVAADDLRAGAEPAPLEPLYLRRPDAVEPGARKRVGVGC